MTFFSTFRMNYLKDIASKQPLLQKLLDASLAKSALRTHRACKQNGNKAQEPDYIADLCINWSQELFHLLKLVLSLKFKIAVTSVYCHQKPLEDFGGIKASEIGDLLLVFRYKSRAGLETYNSVLFQAKVSENPNLKISAGDTQLELYTQQPNFKYRKAGSLNGKKIEIFPKSVNQGAKYLLIDPSLPSCYSLPYFFPFGSSIASNELCLNLNFATEINSFLQFNNGRCIDRKAICKDGWSEMIWDLISITINKTSKRINSGLKDFPRQVTSKSPELLFLTTEDSDQFYLSADANSSSQDIVSMDEQSGVSTILIEVFESE